MENRYLIDEKDLKQLIEDNESSSCVVSHKIMVEGKKVGYMFRDVPEDPLDSGWRFQSGLEPSDYPLENYALTSLNTVCNYDRDIIPLLDSPYETAYKRDDSGNFVQVSY